MPRIFTTSLVLEVTRRCNMCCEHCLRGDAEALDMSWEIAKKALDSFDGISTLVFTGGEPTLNLPLIKKVFDYIRETKKSVDSFWLATNGKEKSLELATLLLENIDLFNDIDMCGVALSIDVFHDPCNGTNPLKFLSFYDDSKERTDTRHLLRRGRAAKNGMGEERKVNSLYMEVDDNSVDFELIYVSANGSVVGDCDLPFAEMEEYAETDIFHIREWACSSVLA